jgi:uncharacterized protein YcbK (DUF882 family)
MIQLQLRIISIAKVMQSLSRRHFIFSVLGAGVSLALPVSSQASGNTVKALSFYNLHTEEKLSLTYSEKGKYVSGALSELNHFLRDYRTGDVHTVNPELYDQLHRLQSMVETPGAFHVISGFRSPKTNNSLHEHSGGVAKNSLHMQGCAIDIRLPGKDLSHLHKAALAMAAGGVGYYPGSDFIHLDTGRVRHWG